MAKQKMTPARKGPGGGSPTEDRLASLERLLEEFLGEPLLRRLPFPSPSYLLRRLHEDAWWPKVDVAETESGFKVMMDLPGVKTEDVEIEIEGNRLVVKGETAEQNEGDRERWHRTERSRGSFYRAFDLPADINADKTEGELKDGTLTLRIPKNAKPTATKKIALRKK